MKTLSQYDSTVNQAWYRRGHAGIQAARQEKEIES
jgi:phage terminase Nu1 subunit (DNA packaging protein)